MTCSAARVALTPARAVLLTGRRGLTLSHCWIGRRAQIISMDAIRDDGGTIIKPEAWESAEDFLEAVRHQGKTLRLDRTAGQPTRLVVACEAAGMVPQLARVAGPFGVEVRSNGGFDSVTVKHNFAAELTGHDRPTEVLHIGDHDPSGAHTPIDCRQHHRKRVITAPSTVTPVRPRRSLRTSSLRSCVMPSRHG